MKTIKIYALLDPRNNQVRYIGKTIRTLNQRLTNHICDAKSSRYYNHNINWIKSLINDNILPEILLIDEIPETNSWEWLEQYWISQFKTWGFKLTNLTEGGDGNKNQKFTEESQNKKRETILRKIKSGEISYKERSKKISQSLKGIQRSIKTRELLRNINLGKKQSLNQILAKSKCILQYDLNNNFIREWSSINEASRNLNISKGSISNVCIKRAKTAGGYIWNYKKI